MSAFSAHTPHPVPHLHSPVFKKKLQGAGFVFWVL
jgi:hypothetical protein